MKRSTKVVYECAETISARYFNSSKRWASIQQGKMAFYNRWTQYLNQAYMLNQTAETKAAHDRVDELLRALMVDAQNTRDKYFDR